MAIGKAQVLGAIRSENTPKQLKAALREKAYENGWLKRPKEKR